MVFFEKVTPSDLAEHFAGSSLEPGLWSPAQTLDMLIENKAVQSKQNIGAGIGKSKGSNICFAAVSERLVAIGRNF